MTAPFRLLSLFLSAAITVIAAEQKPIHTVLIVGDSISEHAPAEKLNWTGHWGMAATSQDKDYVHRLVARITEAQGSAPELRVHAKGGGTITGKLEDPALLAKLATGADLIVVQLGENDRTVTVDGFQKPYDTLLRLLRQASPGARIICTAVWAPPAGNGLKDRLIRELCQSHGLSFADLSAANKDPLNKAEASGLWTNNGVNWHPGDAGMEAYATAIWTVFTKENPTPIAAAAPLPSATVPAVAPIAKTTGVLFQEIFATPAALDNWGPHIATLTQDGPPETPGALKITAATANASTLVRLKLPVAEFVGHTVKVTARIKTAGLSTPPKSYNGVKVQLTLMNAEGDRDYPQAKLPFLADQPWTEISFTHLVPDTIVELYLRVGLEKVSGSFWITDIKITPVP